ncbi:hypothetical protein ABEB36_004457 [Hypothenemus hampei]|uniref:Uncharacterized protein n=1 Tax=Hypothenemus hampei TaxID=57062 RepID=A0ABD1F3D3_HYPHA
MGKKRSRSGSREKDWNDQNNNKKLKGMQNQIDNLTNCMMEFIKHQKKESNTTGTLTPVKAESDNTLSASKRGFSKSSGRVVVISSIFETNMHLQTHVQT